MAHCSAGVGRSGTLVAIDGLIQQLREEKQVQIFNMVVELRHQRNFLVQSVVSISSIMILQNLGFFLDFCFTNIVSCSPPDRTTNSETTDPNFFTIYWFCKKQYDWLRNCENS